MDGRPRFFEPGGTIASGCEVRLIARGHVPIESCPKYEDLSRPAPFCHHPTSEGGFAAALSSPSLRRFGAAAGGAETRVELVAINTPKRVLFIMPTDASGAYHVQVRRRHLRPDGPLLEDRLNEPIVPA